MSLLLAHWRIVAVGALAAASVTLFVSWRTGIEEAAAARALAEVAQERLDASLDSLDIERERRTSADSQAAQSLRELLDERVENERAERVAEAAVRLAEQDVTVTLDSIRDNPTPEIREVVNRLEVQLEVERTANQTLVRSLRSQLAVADSTAGLWQTRYAAAQPVIAAQDRVIRDYEARLEVGLRQGEGSWTDPVVTALKYAGVFAAGYALGSR